ncbi:hypothetical protein MUP77_01080 [Candidatus Bathyarchaeota archaeon]|nr:hypothetical protein [Candidatus Bathyarchaeota archaeon]
MTETEYPEIEETVEECGCKVRKVLFKKDKICIFTVDSKICSKNHINDLSKPRNGSYVFRIH